MDKAYVVSAFRSTRGGKQLYSSFRGVVKPGREVYSEEYGGPSLCSRKKAPDGLPEHLITVTGDGNNRTLYYRKWTMSPDGSKGARLVSVELVGD